MINYIDTHSHIYLSQFDEDRKECISRAVSEGVYKIILPNIDAQSVKPMLDTVSDYPEACYPLIGLHPTHVKNNFEEELDVVLSTFESHHFLGIGEIGIDLYWDKTFIEEQKFVFERQVRFALERDLPVIVHARDSFQEIIDVLKNINAKKFKGIFHAFAGFEVQAQEVISMGFLIGLGGVVTFKNSTLPGVVKQLDLNHIVLETDSPYLAPTPHRGKRNESAYIPLIAEKIAAIKTIGVEKVAEITTNNACKVFNL